MIVKHIGLDLGFGNVKVYDSRGATVFASHLASPGVAYASDDESTDNETAMIEFSGVRYAVGESAFTKGSEIAGLGMQRLLGSMEVKAGGTLRFRYRVVIHAGDTAAANIAAEYAKYSAAK